jgi:hypothetical protein
VGDRVSFSYIIDTANCRRIIKRTFKTVDKLGKEVERGERGYKRTLRTPAQRMPVSRRELRSADRD